MNETVVIIGGGIAGITCLETLIQNFDGERPLYKTIILISSCRLLKRVANYRLRGRNLETFDVTETDIDNASYSVPGLDVRFIVGYVEHVNVRQKTVFVTGDGSSPCANEYHYDILSICIGSSPKTLRVPGVDDSFIQSRILTIRDTTSIDELGQKLTCCRRIAIVGNGGISLDLVRKISDCEKVWIVRDDFIGYPFLDSGASKFLLDDASHDGNPPRTLTEFKFTTSEPVSKQSFGPALGPNWLQQHDLKGNYQSGVNMIYQTEVTRIDHSEDHTWPLSVVLTSGRKVDCDLIVTAIGVLPNSLTILGGDLETSQNDGGILVDENMKTSIEDVYAAGDVVSCEKWTMNDLWFQMRLWTQARQMGHYCGRCITSNMIKSDPSIYFNFDCFTHSTVFFGKKVVLLGRYNPQNVCDEETKELEVIARIKPCHDYAKLILKTGRIIGAVLVGDSGLEETIENLIHDQIDVSGIKNQLLDDTIDIEDYFD